MHENEVETKRKLEESRILSARGHQNFPHQHQSGQVSPGNSRSGIPSQQQQWIENSFVDDPK